ncbi:MAG: hypothetical protein Q7U54_05365 [Bacteroidales bacterium]|nr:hypothetical protein [Bacteroidales bacterium]
MKKLTYLISIVILMGISFSCSKSEDSNPTTDTPGPKFLAAKSVISSSCALSGCHVSPSNTGGINFETNATIVANGSLIKSRAVDLGTMPPTVPLSAAAKTAITDWITAGGRLTD